MKTSINNSNLLADLKMSGLRVIPIFCAVFYGMIIASSAVAQNYGINFVGNTTDPVTDTVGIVPIPGWTNISSSFNSGTITSSDGSQLATLTMAGAWPGDGGWNSTISQYITVDGANLSLMDGFWDGAVERQSVVLSKPGEPATREIGCYASSLAVGQSDDRAILAAIRGHWSAIENGTHYRRDALLDVMFLPGK